MDGIRIGGNGPPVWLFTNYHLPTLAAASRVDFNPMPELLLELGCEELPATFVRKAYEDLRKNLEGLVQEAGILQGEASEKGPLDIAGELARFLDLLLHRDPLDEI